MTSLRDRNAISCVDDPAPGGLSDRFGPSRRTEFRKELGQGEPELRRRDAETLTDLANRPSLRDQL